jgi:thiamine-phosphate pyrophosphorylase
VKIPPQFGFYAVLTNPLKGYEYCTRIVVDAGIRFVQLRIKDQPPSYISAIAEKMRRITANSNTLLIINDHAVIAHECGADGVHLGQEDMTFGEARSIVGPEAVIGLSTHNPSQTMSANTLKPDYIGIGPVFPTPTKKNPDPVIGIDGMITMLGHASIPAVAIGGIDCTNLHLVLDAGAKNFCMVRQFTKSEAPEKALKDILRIYRSYYPQF